MNNFGGDWTKAKIDILVEYAKAYLTIMRRRPYYKLLYFDGFAGSGFIIKDKNMGVDITVGAARRIVEISEPKAFDMYYFVEKDIKNARLLKKNTQEKFPQRKIIVLSEDGNRKMIHMANFLRNPKNRNYRTLAYIDPCGMQVEWSSIEVFRDLPIDMWILVPTGLGVNRLLKKNGMISEAWLERLEKFLGMERTEIEKFFYKRIETLFPELSYTKKEEDAIERSAKLYQSKLKSVFKYVSKPYELKNKMNSIMYHLYLATNNDVGLKIANEIVKKYNA